MQTARPPIIRVHLEQRELLVDLFAGGGGGSEGIRKATGRDPDIAVNHDAEALAMHEANHPNTKHLREDVWHVDPVKVCEGKPVAHAHFSPDCTYFSKARGAKPFRDRRKATRRRSLASVVVRWANAVRPRVITVENVEEFQDWGPLGADGLPDPARIGSSFRFWVRQLERAGYVVDWRELKACDYGAPTSRKRLFVIARCDGGRIVWPPASHSRTGDLLGLKPWRAAAECINWEIPALSIFASREEARAFAKRYDLDGVPQRPLAEKTLLRVARGMHKFVLGPNPFIVPLRGSGSTHTASHSIDDPLSVISAQGTHHALVAPILTEHANASNPRSWRADEPLRTQCANVKGGHFALVAPVLVNTRNGEREGQAPRVFDIEGPYPTITAQGSQGGLVSAFLARHFGRAGTPGNDLRGPVGSITSRDHTSLVTTRLDLPPGTRERTAQVRAFLMAYYGTSQTQELGEPLATVTTRDRFGLVTVAGVDHEITDIAMRMLQPRELFNATGFRRDYVIDPFMEAHWRHEARGDVWVEAGPLGKSSQVRMCGNSVPPDVVAALVAANLAEPPAFAERSAS